MHPFLLPAEMTGSLPSLPDGVLIETAASGPEDLICDHDSSVATYSAGTINDFDAGVLSVGNSNTVQAKTSPHANATVVRATSAILVETSPAIPFRFRAVIDESMTILTSVSSKSLQTSLFFLMTDSSSYGHHFFANYLRLCSRAFSDALASHEIVQEFPSLCEC